MHPSIAALTVVVHKSISLFYSTDACLRVYYVIIDYPVMGRHEDSAEKVLHRLSKANPECQHRFAMVDASMLRSIREACAKFKESNDKLDILVTSQGGAPNLAGRMETREGLDAKMVTREFYFLCALHQGHKLNRSQRH